MILNNLQVAWHFLWVLQFAPISYHQFNPNVGRVKCCRISFVSKLSATVASGSVWTCEDLCAKDTAPVSSKGATKRSEDSTVLELLRAIQNQMTETLWEHFALHTNTSLQTFISRAFKRSCLLKKRKTSDWEKNVFQGESTTCSGSVGDDGVAELGDPRHPYYNYAVRSLDRVLFCWILLSLFVWDVCYSWIFRICYDVSIICSTSNISIIIFIVILTVCKRINKPF